MQVEIPQDLEGAIRARFPGVNVEEYVVRAIRDVIDEASPAGACWAGSQSAVDKFYEED